MSCSHELEAGRCGPVSPGSGKFGTDFSLHSAGDSPRFSAIAVVQNERVYQIFVSHNIIVHNRKSWKELKMLVSHQILPVVRQLCQQPEYDGLTGTV
jgi:hypothetical protein